MDNLEPRPPLSTQPRAVRLCENSI